MSDRIRLGVSRCLLGESVRYDGGHKLDHYLADTLGKYVEFVSVCPEVDCGLAVPREAMRLVGDPANPRLLTRQTGRDMTAQMMTWVQRRLGELEKEDLGGFIFKSKSPSSGMERVKVYNDKGVTIGTTSGLFAREFMRRFPLLPVEDEGRLHDPELRENFIERIFALKRYRDTVRAVRTPRSLVEFQAHHKLQLMSHSTVGARELGRLTAEAGKAPLAATLGRYEERLLKTLALQATAAKHTNVLMHMLGYFRAVLSADEKRELLDLIERFRTGQAPLVVPVTLLKHYVRKYSVEYLAGQTYLDPQPTELTLRYHA